MELLIKIFGEGSELNVYQMSSRAFVIFLYTLILIRIAGRRSFGLRNPFDNIILILLGAILGRAVVGVSAFLPTIIAGLTICLSHRLLARAMLAFPALDTFLNGQKIPLYQKGRLLPRNLRRSLVNTEDLHTEVRLSTQLDSLEEFDVIYMEKNGKISAVRKDRTQV